MQQSFSIKFHLLYCSQLEGRVLPIVEKRAVVASGDWADSEDSHISMDNESSSDHEVCFYGGENGLFCLVSKLLFQYACAGQ